MTRGIALLLTSTSYFFVWAIFVFALFSNNNYEPVLVGLSAAIDLPILSVMGSLIFVALNQKKSDKWFLGLPLLVVFLTLLLCLYVSGALSVNATKLTPVISLYVPPELFVLLLVLGAPASLLFIKSVPEELRESTKKYVKVAKVISIYAVILGFIYFIDNFLLLNSSLANIMLMIYVPFGLPPIGICLVLMARKFHIFPI